MKIALLGDVALYGRFTKKNDYKKVFSSVQSKLELCDYVIANLETPLTYFNGTIGGRSAYIKGEPEDVEILKYLNITHVSLANNHSFDFCKEGIEDTIKTLQENGIEYYGIGNRCCFLEDDNNKIIIRGYCCYSTNGRAIDKSCKRINALSYEKVIKDLDSDKENGYKTILSMHWGIEHVHYPCLEHVKLSHIIADKYNVVIHGHHPHVVQGVEYHNNSFIAYSLGNFCFDDVYTYRSDKPLIKLSKDNKTTFIAIIEIINNEILGVEIIPFSFLGDCYEECEEVRENLKEYSMDFGNYQEINRKQKEELLLYRSRHKKERDINWYIKRLNMESVRIIYYEHQCKKNYQKKLLRYL